MLRTKTLLEIMHSKYYARLIILCGTEGGLKIYMLQYKFMMYACLCPEGEGG
jgi:hypothetical protein